MAVPPVSPPPPVAWYPYAYVAPPDQSRTVWVIVLIVILAVVLPIALMAILWFMVSGLLGSPVPGPLPAPWLPLP